MPLNKAVNLGNDGLQTPYINLNASVTTLGSSTSTPSRGNAYPLNPRIGDEFFNTTINELQVYTTNGWVSTGTKPNSPTNVVAVSAQVPYGGLPGAIITWTPATTGTPASYYLITSNTGGFSQTTTGTSVTIIGLTVATSYTFTVAAVNSYGSSSSNSNSLTPVTVPQAPTTGTPTITAAGLSVPVTAGGTGGSSITSYTVTSNPGNLSVTSASSPVVLTTNVPVTGGTLTAGTTYSFTATANNAVGSSLSSVSSSKEIDLPYPVTSGLLCDYDIYRGSYGGQNWVPYSEDFTNATYWNSATYACTVTLNATTDPFGGNAGQLVVAGASNPALVYSNQVASPSVTGVGQQIVSVYAKYYNSSYFTLNCYYNTDTECNVQFFLDGSMNITGDGLVSGSASISYVGNGWYYCQYTMPARVNAGTSYSWRIWPAGRGLTSAGCYFFGAQMRNSGTALGYLKTTSAYLNYNTGSTLYDLSGNGYNTSISNFSYSNTSTNGYGGILFQGASNSGGTMPNMGSGLAASTITFWINRQPGSAGGADMFIAGSIGYNFGDASWSGPYGEYYYPHTITPPYDGSQWHHYTFVMNSNYTYSIYHDGYLEATTGVLSAGTSNLTGIIIANGYGARYFKGYMGKLSVYNRALTASEVLQNFNAHRTRYGI